MAPSYEAGKSLNVPDTVFIDQGAPELGKTNNFSHGDEHVVLYALCLTLLAVCGAMLCLYKVITGGRQCTPEKNKMRYVYMLVKNCARTGKRSGSKTGLPNCLGFYNRNIVGHGAKIVNSDGVFAEKCLKGEKRCVICESWIKGTVNRPKSIGRFFKIAPSDIWTASSGRQVAMNAENVVGPESMSGSLTESFTEPFADQRLSEVVAKILDIEPTGNDVTNIDSSDDGVIYDEDERVTAFVDYVEEPRNKGLFREPLKTIEEEEDSVSQTSMNDVSKMTSEEVVSPGIRDFTMETHPLRSSIKAKSMETVFGVFPTTTSTTTETTFVNNEVLCNSGLPGKETKFRWSVTSV